MLEKSHGHLAQKLGMSAFMRNLGSLVKGKVSFSNKKEKGKCCLKVISILDATKMIHCHVWFIQSIVFESGPEH
jgi:hypothetical protein